MTVVLNHAFARVRGGVRASDCIRIEPAMVR